MDIKEIYNQIGCAGIALVIIGVFALTLPFGIFFI